jgi:uncharacterized lipoprotein YddW (UPF0748 family)
MEAACFRGGPPPRLFTNSRVLFAPRGLAFTVLVSPGFLTRLLAVLALTAASARGTTYGSSILAPPSPTREFRGVWVASVSNINWPSKPGLSTAEQQAELLALLDRAAALRLNAVLLQVRPACDALYPSKLEPWSEYLTGQQGRAPSPAWDPLALACREAHRRGLELHAWLNPYRAQHSSAKSALAASHISKRKPDLARTYGKQLWLDPGDPRTQDHVLAVIKDLVRRYDVDGVHFDDYFYPYVEKTTSGNELEFPDDATWRKYGQRTGLSREDWRRRNVDTFIQRAQAAIRAEKPGVKFGLSPFGIWRPGFPAPIRGYDAYAKLYADARKWLASGWCDYLAPQLYWQIAPPEQSFTALLAWWQQQNVAGRHVWPGLNSVKAATWKPAEIQQQIAATRRASNAPGHLHWSYSALARDINGLAPALLASTYAARAVVPAYPWKGSDRLGQPRLTIVPISSGGLVAAWSLATGQKHVRQWLVQTRTDGEWRTQILPGDTTSASLGSPAPSHVAVTALDRFGNAGPVAVVGRQP